MLARPSSRRGRRKIKRGNRLLRRYRLKTNTLVKSMVPLQPGMSREQIADFIDNLKTVANVIPKK